MFPSAKTKPFAASSFKAFAENFASGSVGRCRSVGCTRAIFARAARSRRIGRRSLFCTSGTIPLGKKVSSRLLHSRMQTPFCVRPARPVRCTAFCKLMRLSFNRFLFCSALNSVVRSRPESITPVTLGIVKLVSAMFVERITRGASVLAKISRSTDLSCPP